MTEIEKQALVLFRDHSFLILKSYKVSTKGLSPLEIETIDKALDYHRSYNTCKMKKK